MSKVTVKEIMDIIDDVLELYNSEYDALEIRIDQLIKSKESTECGCGAFMCDCK